MFVCLLFSRDDVTISGCVRSSAHLIAVLAGQSTPGIAKLILISAIAGSIATLFVVVVAYYTTMGSFRFGLDPDTYGIPVVTSSLDLVGAFTVILAMVLTGVI